MDTTNEYVNMCRKATEIQHAWNSPKEGDFAIQVNDAVSPENILSIGSLCGDMVSVGRRDRGCTPTISFHPMHWIWLPRIDQLIDLCLEKMEDGRNWHHVMNVVNETEKYYLATEYPTLEQSLLATLMDAEYHKRWNGSEWVEA